PEAFFNFITLLGWSPTGEEEIFNQTELIEIFDPERLSTSAAVFDQNKLKWMNGEYITKASKEKLIDITMPHLIASGVVPKNMSESDREWTEEVIQLYQAQLDYGAQIVELTSLFFKTAIASAEPAPPLLTEAHALAALPLSPDNSIHPA